MIDEISSKKIGLLFVMMKEFKSHKLPRLMSMKSKLDKGGILNQVEIDFLTIYINDAKRNLSLVMQNPVLHGFCSKTTSLYCQITSSALKNEKLFVKT